VGGIPKPVLKYPTYTTCTYTIGNIHHSLTSLNIPKHTSIYYRYVKGGGGLYSYKGHDLLNPVIARDSHLAF